MTGTKSKINSRDKGCRGERDWAAFLRGYGFNARRGQQFSGSNESPDVVCNELPYHWEVKYVERGNPYGWLAQAIGDAAGRIAVVAHRRNHKDWIVVLQAEDFVKMAKELEELRGKDLEVNHGWPDAN